MGGRELAFEETECCHQVGSMKLSLVSTATNKRPRIVGENDDHDFMPSSSSTASSPSLAPPSRGPAALPSLSFCMTVETLPD